MNSKERFLKALRCEEPDRVPIFESWIDHIKVLELADRLGIVSEATSTKYERLSGLNNEGSDEHEGVVTIYIKVVQKLGLDATSYNFSIGMEQISKNKGKDKYGRLYKLSEHGEPMPVEGAVESDDELLEFDMASRLEESDFNAFKKIVNLTESEVAHVISIPDPFKVSWRIRGGMENFLKDFIRDAEFTKNLLELSEGFVLKAIDIAIDIGADAIFLPGDFAGEKNPIISPVRYREYIKPLHARIVDRVHSKNRLIIKHTDGNAWELLDDFIEVGFDGLHPVQPQSMDIKKVKKYLSGKMAVLGNIDCRNLLPFGEEEEVKSTVRRTLEEVAPGGGYIVSSSNSIHPDVDTDNYITMVNAVHKYGGYK